MAMKKSVFYTLCLLLAINFTSFGILLFSGKAHAEEAEQKNNWQPSGYDGTCITSCPDCTIYTHPISACRLALYKEYKALLNDMIERHNKEVKAKNDKRN